MIFCMQVWYTLKNIKLKWVDEIKQTCTYRNIDWPRDYRSKWSKTEKDKYHVLSLMCGI